MKLEGQEMKWTKLHAGNFLSHIFQCNMPGCDDKLALTDIVLIETYFTEPHLLT